MNENVKKGLLIAVVVIAVVVAGWQISKSVTSEQPHVEAVVNTPPGHKSEKEQFLENQAKNGGSPKSEDPKTQADKEAALAGG